jgi:FixJ family two-component response regulator
VLTEPLIAVVDDDESFRIELVEALDSFGYGACGFASAEEFLAKDGDKIYDCVITDIHMPGMSGFDLKRLLTSRGCVKPVIMITGQIKPALETEAIACGAICLLGKPFEGDILIGYIKRASNI